MEDLILWDFGVHWFDFLASVIGDRVRSVYATAARAAGQTARPPLLAQALISFDGGQATLVFDGATRYGARDSTSVVGANGVASSHGPDLGHQAVELYTEAGVSRPRLTGSWFNDGFAGAMGELLCAIEDGREPLNSARGNLLSLKLCQAALRSVRAAAPVAV
jgi:predicted dehydrogenase